MTVTAEAQTATGVAWAAPVLMLEGIETGDRRLFEDVSWRDLPLPLRWDVEDDGAHSGAIVVGRIDSITRGENGVISATGTFADTPEAAEVVALIEGEFLRGVSVDLGDVDEYDFEVRDVDEDGFPTDWIERFTGVSIMAATLVAIPAFEDAHVVLSSGDDRSGDPRTITLPNGEPRGAFPEHPFPITASARVAVAVGPISPPASWFDDPALSEATPLTVTEDGRVFGHVAEWNTCHLSYPESVCVVAPHSASAYAHFRLGSVVCDDGTEVAIGHITVGTGHANERQGPAAAREHYDHTGAAVADVACGEDSHGIWIAGALRPDATPEQIRTLRASPPSGDWRRIAGHLELVGVLAVNVPGFPVARVASGVQTTLIASLAPLKNCGCGSASTDERLALLEKRVSSLSKLVEVRPLSAKVSLVEGDRMSEAGKVLVAEFTRAMRKAATITPSK